MGSANTDKVARQRLRDRLRAKGLPEDEVQRLLAVKRAEQQQARGSAEPAPPAPVRRPASLSKAELQAEYDRWYKTHRHVDPSRPQRIEDETYARLSPKDSAHRPRPVDPLLTGHGRATGETARAVKRGRTVTKFEHRERDASQGDR